MMEVLFNIVCFALSIAVVATAACSFVRVSGLKGELRETEAGMLIKRARLSANPAASVPRKQTAGARHPKAEMPLTKAGLSVTASQWRIISVSAAALAGVFLVLASAGSGQEGIAMRLLVSCSASLVVLLAFRKYLSHRIRKQTLLLEKQLAQAEMQIAENSRSGLPISRSIISCAELADEPLKSHLRRLHNEMTYSGCTLADGFSNMASRTGSSDAQLLAEVIAIQQQTGSNLADALDFLHETIARRLEMRQSLRSALAETKITKTIVAITPWAIFVLLSFAPLIKIEGFWDFYSNNPAGWIVLATCIVVEAAILALISRMSKLDID